MNINMIRKKLAGLLILLVSGTANAGLITIGGLTLENAGDSYVTDHVNNVDYLRWDQVKHLSFSELTTSLQTGNAYDGWEIASLGQANDFVNALLDGTSGCNSSIGFDVCSTSYTYTDFITLMGSSYDRNLSYTYAWFLSDNKFGSEVGYIEANVVRLSKSNEWSSFATSDTFSSTGTNSALPIGFMLYREHAEVPEPSTLAIFALGMIGLASRRFKKQS